MFRSKRAASIAAVLSGVLAVALFAGCGGGGSRSSSGHIYVADTGNSRLVRMDDMAGTNFTVANGNITSGNGVGQFLRPSYVAFDSAGRVYVSDTGNHRIIRMNDISESGWTFLGSAPGGVSTPGSGTDQFNLPAQIAIDAQNRIYIADSGNNRIVRMDDMAGTNWVAFGTQGSGQNQFNDPFGIAVDSAGHIYVADKNNNRIVRMDDMNGTNWTVFGTQGSGQNQLNAPSGLFVDATNRIYIADTGNNRIARVDDITGTNWAVSTANQLNGPSGVFVDSTNHVYVADTGNSRITRMDDISGANFAAVGSAGSLAGQFTQPLGVALH
jgi:streptogramin lyase